MHSQPYQPLEAMQAEIDRLRKHLSNLFSEKTILKTIVEEIYRREEWADRYMDQGNMDGNDANTKRANALVAALEERGITIEDDENDMDIVHVMRGQERCFTFHTAEWRWQNKDGSWPWEHENSN